MRSLRLLIAASAICWGLLSATAANANSITIQTGAIDRGTLSDLGLPVTFLGYTSPLTLDSIFPYTAQTTIVNPADEATLVPIANIWFGTTFGVPDDHRTIVGGLGFLQFDIFTEFFSLTVGQNSTAFFHNETDGPLHLTYTQFTGVAGGLSHYDQFGSPVPGPIVGAGLPGLIIGCTALLALARRRRRLATAW